MSAIASLGETYEITDDNPGLLLHDVRSQLQPRSTKLGNQATAVALRLMRDETPAEIQAEMGLTPDQYAAHCAALRVCFAVR